MLDPQGLYERHEPPAGPTPRVLIQALSGFVDAGGATRLVGEHLLALDGQPVASFDIDQTFDYRSRRPPMVFAGTWESYTEPTLALYQLTDSGGVPFLLLTGPEPDLQWRRFTSAVRTLIDELGVRLTVGLNTIPMAVPHTRPVGITAYATNPDLIAGYEAWTQRVQVPGSAGHLLEHELGKDGRDVMGFAVHVPHYIAQMEYPAAAELLLTSVSRATGLLFPTEQLREAAEAVRADLDKQLARDKDASALVQALEQQYDAHVRGNADSSPIAGSTGPLPDADELGAAFERFLAEQSGHDD